MTNNTFIAYRLGAGSDSLKNRNAGNPEAVGHRLAVMDDYDAPQSNNAGANKVSVWLITAEEFTDYVYLNRMNGKGNESLDHAVGRKETGTKRKSISYAFGETGYEATKLVDLDLAALRERAVAAYPTWEGVSNTWETAPETCFDMIGSWHTADILEAAMREAL